MLLVKLKLCLKLFGFFQDVEFPENMSEEMKSILQGLLKREVSERLGCEGRG